MGGSCLRGSDEGVNPGPIWPCLALFTPGREVFNGDLLIAFSHGNTLMRCCTSFVNLGNLAALRNAFTKDRLISGSSGVFRS